MKTEQAEYEPKDIDIALIVLRDHDMLEEAEELERRYYNKAMESEAK